MTGDSRDHPLGRQIETSPVLDAVSDDPPQPEWTIPTQPQENPVHLTDFLKARLDDDDRLAETLERSSFGFTRPGLEAHAHRAIFDLALGLSINNDGHGSVAQDGDEILRHLASVYADHPDFNEIWRP